MQGTEGLCGWGMGAVQELMISNKLGDLGTLPRVFSNGKILQCYKQGCVIIRYVI